MLAVPATAIPDAYRESWVPFQPHAVLEHTTTQGNWEQIKASGYLEPRDPSPYTWAGMRAVFLSDTLDPLYPSRIPRVLAHVRKKGGPLVRLLIRTEHTLFKSLDPERTAQVISLQPIPLSAVVRVEAIASEA